MPKRIMQIKSENPQGVRGPTVLITDHQYTQRSQETIAIAEKIPNLLDLPRHPLITIVKKFSSPHHSVQ